MDEREWLACRDPHEMLGFLSDCDRASQRKLRLFAVACFRRIWHFVEDERAAKAAEVAEQFADGFVGPAALTAAYASAREAESGFDLNQPGSREWVPFVAALGVAASTAETAAGRAARFAVEGAGAAVCHSLPWLAEEDPQDPTLAARLASRAAEHEAQCVLLRDIFGNPLLRRTVKPSWRTPPVLALAVAAYEIRM